MSQGTCLFFFSIGHDERLADFASSGPSNNKSVLRISELLNLCSCRGALGIDRRSNDQITSTATTVEKVPRPTLLKLPLVSGGIVLVAWALLFFFDEN